MHRSHLTAISGRVLAERGEYGEAVASLQSALDFADEERDPVNYCGIHGILSKIYQTLGDYSTSLNHPNLAAKAAERHQRVVISSLASVRIGQIHTELKDYDRASEAFRFAHSLVPDDQTTIHQNIIAAEVTLATKTGATEEGIALCNQLLASLAPDDRSSHRYATLSNLSSFYARLEHHARAREYLEEAVWVLEETGAIGEKLRKIKSDLARVMIRLGETDAKKRATVKVRGVKAGFFTALGKRFPNLTPKQERLCGLIRSGLKTPDIAALPRSAKTRLDAAQTAAQEVESGEGCETRGVSQKHCRSLLTGLLFPFLKAVFIWYGIVAPAAEISCSFRAGPNRAAYREMFGKK